MVMRDFLFLTVTSATAGTRIAVQAVLPCIIGVAVGTIRARCIIRRIRCGIQKTALARAGTLTTARLRITIDNTHPNITATIAANVLWIQTVTIRMIRIATTAKLIIIITSITHCISILLVFLRKLSYFIIRNAFDNGAKKLSEKTESFYFK